MNNTPLLTLLLLCMPCAYVQGITINASLAHLAEIDIVIAKNALPPASFVSEFFNTSSRMIAGYSFLLNSDNTISLWQRLYDKAGVITLLLPAQRLMMPLENDNPFTIELTPEQIQAIVGEQLSQVYLQVLQRTYAWDHKTKTLKFFAYNVLAETTYLVDANLSLNASGLIASEKLDTVPNSLKNTYTVAFGSLS